MISSFHAPRKPSCPSWHDVSLHCSKQRQKGCKPAAFLEHRPIPLGKQLNNRCLCRVLVWGGRARSSLMGTVTMAGVQGGGTRRGVPHRDFSKGLQVLCSLQVPICASAAPGPVVFESG